jgi:hypothetical protein
VIGVESVAVDVPAPPVAAAPEPEADTEETVADVVPAVSDGEYGEKWVELGFEAEPRTLPRMPLELLELPRTAPAVTPATIPDVTPVTVPLPVPSTDDPSVDPAMAPAVMPFRTPAVVPAVVPSTLESELAAARINATAPFLLVLSFFDFACAFFRRCDFGLECAVGDAFAQAACGLSQLTAACEEVYPNPPQARTAAAVTLPTRPILVFRLVTIPPILTCGMPPTIYRVNVRVQ